MKPILQSATVPAGQMAPSVDEINERRILSLICNYPVRALELAQRAGITPEYFTIPAYGEAFAELLKAAPSNNYAASDIVRKYLCGLSNEEVEKFINLAVLHECEFRMSEFAAAAVSRNTLKKLLGIFANRDLPTIAKIEDASHVVAEARVAVRSIIQLTCGSEPDADAGESPIPAALLDAPGFIHDLVEYTLATANRPNRVVAFAGALAMLSLLAARKFTDATNSRSNLYLVALANSSSGKDYPRKVNRSIARQHLISRQVADNFASGQGIEDALVDEPALLFQVDEFDTILRSLNGKKDSAVEAVYQNLLSLFSKSSSSLTPRKLAKTAAQRERPRDAASRSDEVDGPSLSILGTAIPAQFYPALSERTLTDGLAARCLILEAGKAADLRAKVSTLPIPESVSKTAGYLAEKCLKPEWRNPQKLQVVPDDPAAEAVRIEILNEGESHRREGEKNDDQVAMSVWGRMYEMCCKLSLLYAVSENALSPRITAEGLRWARDLVCASYRRTLAMAARFASEDNPLEAKVRKALDMIRRTGAVGCKRSKVTKKLAVTSKEMDDIEATLLDRQQITVVGGAKGGKIYRAIEEGK